MTASRCCVNSYLPVMAHLTRLITPILLCANLHCHLSDTVSPPVVVPFPLHGTCYTLASLCLSFPLHFLQALAGDGTSAVLLLAYIPLSFHSLFFESFFSLLTLCSFPFSPSLFYFFFLSFSEVLSVLIGATHFCQQVLGAHCRVLAQIFHQHTLAGEEDSRPLGMIWIGFL